MTVRTQPTPRTAAPSLRVIPGRRVAGVRLPTWLLLTLAVILMFFGIIYSRVNLDRSAFELRDIQQQISVEEAINQERRLEVARLQAPDRIYEEAQRLGLVLPTEPSKTVPAVRPGMP